MQVLRTIELKRNARDLATWHFPTTSGFLLHTAKTPSLYRWERPIKARSVSRRFMVKSSPVSPYNHNQNAVLPMKSRSLFWLLPACVFAIAACEPQGAASGDFNLPEGDAAKGQQHFVTLGCVSCHRIRDVDLPEPEERGPVRVLLGSTTRITSYGDLATSIVNPSHRLSPRYRKDEISKEGESLMTSNNDVMTVTQLTDLIAFLQPHYQKVSRPRYTYRTYRYSADASEDAATDE